MDFTLQYSDNGSTWTTAITVTGQTAWTANESRTFTGASSAHAWWRLNITANNGDATYTEVCELEMRSGGGNNLALATNVPELIVKGTGLSGTDEIYVGLQRYASSTSDWFNWRVAGIHRLRLGQRFRGPAWRIPCQRTAAVGSVDPLLVRLIWSPVHRGGKDFNDL